LHNLYSLFDYEYNDKSNKNRIFCNQKLYLTFVCYVSYMLLELINVVKEMERDIYKRSIKMSTSRHIGISELHEQIIVDRAITTGLHSTIRASTNQA
jgi:hypothetical protein